MNIKLLLSTIISVSASVAWGQDFSKENEAVVTKFIECIKTNNKGKIAKLVSYPLNREYPLPSIKDKKDFVKHFDEIFDDSLKQVILKSKPASDWAEVGWRGIMLNDGILWLDMQGQITGINYESKAEKEQRLALIEKERKTIHTSLWQFKEPVCILKTAKYLIRIDELNSGKYRYACWPISKTMLDKPDLILNNGEYEADGSGGNHSYTFKSADYTYECSIIIMGEDGMPPAKLTVYKGEKEVVSQDATIEEKN